MFTRRFIASVAGTTLSAAALGLAGLGFVSPARVMGPLVCHEYGTGSFRLLAVC